MQSTQPLDPPKSSAIPSATLLRFKLLHRDDARSLLTRTGGGDLKLPAIGKVVLLTRPGLLTEVMLHQISSNAKKRLYLFADFQVPS